MKHRMLEEALVKCPSSGNIPEVVIAFGNGFVVRGTGGWLWCVRVTDRLPLKSGWAADGSSNLRLAPV